MERRNKGNERASQKGTGKKKGDEKQREEGVNERRSRKGRNGEKK